MTTEQKGTTDSRVLSTDGLGVLRIGQKPIDCGGVKLSVGSRNVSVFGKAGGKNIAVVAAYIVCVFVMGNSLLKASTLPELDGRSVLINSDQELRVATEGNLSKRAIGVFSEVEKNGIESVSVNRSGLLMPLDRSGNVISDKHHSESASATKKPSGVSDDSNERIHDYVRATVIGMWVGLVLSWIIRMENFMAREKTPNDEVEGRAPRCKKDKRSCLFARPSRTPG